MRPFDLLQPQTLNEALDALGSGDAAVRPLAGGTDMIVDVRAGRAAPDVLVSLQKVRELRGIERANGSVRFGAATTLAEFLKHPLLLEHADVARQAAMVFASPLIRNLATVGGNIGSASPAGDLLPPLLALNAQVELVCAGGSRALALDGFFVGPRKTARRPDELIAALTIPCKPRNSGAAFYKLGLRQADAISIVSVAVWIERDAERVRDVRIALGAVAPRPLRAYRAEEILRGPPWNPATVEKAAQIASDECAPINDLRGSAAYRRRMVRVYVRRMLEKAWGESQ